MSKFKIVETLFESFANLINPDWIMNQGGLYLVLVILFVETGLFFGFFLPGDVLLFISGIILASADQTVHVFGHNVVDLVFWQVLFVGSTILGNFVGYWFGSKFGHSLFYQGRKFLFLKQKHITAAQQFYEKRGGFAVTMARFLPIARTFVPIIAGMVKMNFKQFTYYNILGGILWVGGLTTLGFYLGKRAWIADNLEWAILAVLVLASLPVIIKMIFSGKSAASRKKNITKTSIGE